VIAAGCYLASLKIWPWTYCRRCQGGGRNSGSNSKRFGLCRRCGGSGRKLRLGNRVTGPLEDTRAAVTYCPRAAPSHVSNYLTHAT
jgi:hypothetical protein